MSLFLKQSCIARWMVWGLVVFSGCVVAEHEENLAPSKRRPLARVRSWIRGTDLTVKFSGMEGACQSTAVAKKKLESPEGMCRLAFFTAAHCVMNEKNQLCEAIELPGIGNVSSKQMKIEIPKEYFSSAGADPRAPRRGDMATLIFDLPCDKVEGVKPVPLANVDKNGETLVETDHVFLQKRESEAPGNRGGGVQISADVVQSDDSDKFHFDVPTPQGYSIVGGDSGGPVFNQKGQLICPISGSSYEFKRATGQLKKQRTSDDSVLDPFTVVCDKRAISKLKSQLDKYGLSPENATEEDLAEVAPSEPTQKTSVMSESAPPSPPREQGLFQPAPQMQRRLGPIRRWLRN